MRNTVLKNKILPFFIASQGLMFCHQTQVAGFEAKKVLLDSPTDLVAAVESGKEVSISSSVEIKVTIKNNGKSIAKNLKVDSISAPWTLSNSSCGDLAAAATCDLVYKFAPTVGGESKVTTGITYALGSVSFVLTATSYDPLITVDPIYPVNGANWNDYVISNNGGTTRYDQPDKACLGTEDYYSGCIHGGEKKKVVLTYEKSCDGLSLEESLGIFNWAACKVVNGKATFYSIGLKEEKRLGDLIESTGKSFKENLVKVTKSSVLKYQSKSAKWWSNNVTTLPSNPNATDTNMVLDAGGTIYTLTQSALSSGYNVNADKIAIVMLGSSALSYSGQSTGNCVKSSGEMGAGVRCMIGAGTQNFLWFEGVVNNYNAASSAVIGLDLAVVKHSRVRNFRVENSGGADSAIYIYNSSHNLFEKISSFNNGGDVIGLWSTSAKNIYNEFYSSNDFLSIRDQSTDSYFNRMLFLSNGLYGIYSNSVITANNSFHLSSAVNTLSALNVYMRGTNKSLTQYLDINSVNSISTSNANSLLFGQLVLANSNGGAGIQLSTTSETVFTQNLMLNVVSGTNCVVVGGTNPGLVDATCANQGSSNAVLNTSFGVIDSLFVSKVTSDDSSNGSDTSGVGAFSTISTVANLFENFFRGWGKDGSAFPNSDHSGRCSSGNCRIWDARYSKNAAVLKGRSLDGVTVETFTANQTCPLAVHGNKSTQRFGGSYYLFNAAEIINDDLGNDNGLCESSEACIYQPNFGAYLGEGDYLKNGTCKFQDGNVSGITMYAYPGNGG